MYAGKYSFYVYFWNLWLLFLILIDYGNYTCGGYPGVLNTMEVDAQTFAFWGVDQVKLDGCYVDVSQMDQGLIFYILLHTLICKKCWLYNKHLRLSRIRWILERYGTTDGLLVQLARISTKRITIISS